MMNKLTIGNKFYRVLDGNIEILRLFRVNEDKLILKDQKNKRITKTIRDLSNNYTLLNPDGYITFTIAVLENNAKDVIVSLHRKEDIINKYDSPPYAVCRQSIVDLFSNPFIKDENTLYVGLSISQDTCPADVPYEMMLACNGVESMEMVAVYMDDSLSKILSLISVYKYDKVLKNIKESINAMPYDKMFGYCKTLRELLTDNYFMFDFMRGFNITPVDFTIMPIDNKLTNEQIIYFENLLKHTLFNVTVVKYSKDIDLAKIKRKYILVSDKKRSLYIIAYEEGDYNNRDYDILEDKRDYILMKKLTEKHQ